MRTEHPKGTTINHLWGGVVQIEKKNSVGGKAKKKWTKGARKKNDEQRVPEKKNNVRSI